MPKTNKATVTIEFDAAVDPSAPAFQEKLTDAIRNGLQSEGWDDRLAKVVNIEGAEPRKDDPKAGQPKSA